MQTRRLGTRINWRNRLRAFRRRRLYPFWHGIKWPLIGSIWVFGLVLGYLGFYRHSLAAGDQSTTFDLLYRSIQLIVLQSGDVEGFIPWQLNAARYLLPILAAYAAIQALLAIFSDQWQQLRVRLLRNHVILCGLGERGLQLAKEFLENGYQVVVIEEDEENPYLSPVREQGVVALIGDATDKSLLRRAGVPRARYLVAVCADDGTNAEIALQARDLSSLHPGRTLTAFVHIVDLELCTLLAGWSLAASKSDSFRLEFFNVRERGARLILKQQSPFEETVDTGKPPPRILVVGLGKLGRSLIVQAAKEWWMQRASSSQRLRIIVIDRSIERKLELLRLQYPQLDRACEFEIYQMEKGSPEFEKGAFLYDPYGRFDLRAIYICFDDDAHVLMNALSLQRKTAAYKVPIVMRMSRDGGLAAMVKNDHGALDFSQVHAFSLLEETCSLEALLGGALEIMARSIHEGYVEQQKELGDTVQTNPSMVDWEDLPEELKESNRHQAAHVEEKLTVIGCAIQPLTDWNAAGFIFSSAEVEKLAQVEHERWLEERTGRGWSLNTARPKDISRKTSPHLVAWEELSAEAKDYARHMVRGLPFYLARAGYQIYRKV